MRLAGFCFGWLRSGRQLVGGRFSTSGSSEEKIQGGIVVRGDEQLRHVLFPSFLILGRRHLALWGWKSSRLLPHVRLD